MKRAYVFGRPAVLAVPALVLIACATAVGLGHVGIWIWGGDIAGPRRWEVRVADWMLKGASLLLFVPFVLSTRRASAWIKSATLPCPRCAYSLEDRDHDTVWCPECGFEGEYREVARAWRKVGWRKDS